jgi:hypothetical protein
MPLALQVFLIIIPPVIAVAAARALLRRSLSPNVIATAEKVVPYILGTFGGFFGLVAGFMLSNSWVELRALRNAMTAEVNAVADLGDIGANLPRQYDDELRQRIERYLRTVIDPYGDRSRIATDGGGTREPVHDGSAHGALGTARALSAANRRGGERARAGHEQGDGRW